MHKNLPTPAEFLSIRNIFSSFKIQFWLLAKLCNYEINRKNLKYLTCNVNVTHWPGIWYTLIEILISKFAYISSFGTNSLTDVTGATALTICIRQRKVIV